MEKFEEIRKLSSIDREELTTFIFGGSERRSHMDILLNATVRSGFFRDPRVLEKGRKDVIMEALQRLFDYLKNPKSTHYTPDSFYGEAFSNENVLHPGGVGWLMTSKILQVMGSEEQNGWWYDKIVKHQIMTSYAQTEIAHGSDVQSLQTLATFDEVSQEFILHTPSIEAMKWWPGDLGVFCTHSCVFARMIIKGVDHGVQMFFCEIRDYDTHVAKPGVEVGDIGPKMGYASKDNGFMKFTKFRIPKSSLLCKYIKVSPTGEVTKVGDPKVMYSSMMFIRTGLLGTSYYNLLKNALIGLRYSIVRRQFHDSQGQEIPIIRYQMQKQKIYTQLCRGLVMNTAFISLLKDVGIHTENVKKGDFSLMRPLHIDLCSHKAWFTEWLSYGTIETIRACGGHGYNAFSGLTVSLTDDFPNMILEGENSVLFLQVARDLLSCLKRASTGKVEKLKGSTAYFKRLGGEFDLPRGEADFRNISKLCEAFIHSCLENTSVVGMKMVEGISAGEDPKAVWDYKLGSRLWDIGKLQGINSILMNAQKRISTLKTPLLREVYEKVLNFFILDQVELNAKMLMR